MSEYQLKEIILKAADVMKLRESAGWHNLAEGTLNKALENSIFFASFHLENEAIAMGRIVGDGFQYFYLQDVIVHPEHQGKGLGKLITENLVNRVKSSGDPGAFFGLMAAEGVAPLYESFGFQQRPSTMPGMGMYLGKS